MNANVPTFVLIFDPMPANEALCGEINLELWAKM